jgi:hypothetical protein
VQHRFVAVLLFAFVGAPAWAGTIEHGGKGFEFRTGDGRYVLQFDTRLQFRASHPSDDNPVTFEPEPDQTTFSVNRARLKVGGRAGYEWLTWFWEYDFPSTRVLDFRVTMPWTDGFGLRVGQWKARYTRERVISSGKQQMMDRSLINRSFTIDRQQGISLLGRIGEGSWHDLNYWASAFTGMGRSGGANDDNHLMYMVRLQWNPLGKRVGFSGSDLARSKPSLSIAVAALTNRSQFTRFSGDGGGQLPGFELDPETPEDPEPGQYRMRQAMFETAFVARGFAWQQELHWKQIEDRKNGGLTELTGNYIQFGYFFAELFESVPPELEIALRQSVLNPDRGRSGDLQYEFGLAANWFFNGHRNKLTASTTWLDYEVAEDDVREEWRVQLQWDVSL